MQADGKTFEFFQLTQVLRVFAVVLLCCSPSFCRICAMPSTATYCRMGAWDPGPEVGPGPRAPHQSFAEATRSHWHSCAAQRRVHVALFCQCAGFKFSNRLAYRAGGPVGPPTLPASISKKKLTPSSLLGRCCMFTFLFFTVEKSSPVFLPAVTYCKVAAAEGPLVSVLNA